MTISTNNSKKTFYAAIQIRMSYVVNSLIFLLFCCLTSYLLLCRCRLVMKELFNKRFGSLFRTYHNPTYFTRRLNRFADIYMSSVVNLLNYPLNHAFYPQRTALPHELSFPSFVVWILLSLRKNQLVQCRTSWLVIVFSVVTVVSGW